MSVETAALAGVEGVITAEQIAASASWLAGLQSRDGAIPWFTGGHCDPWNHVEAAMALTVTGHADAARAAYQWLARRQLANGAWFNYYRGADVVDARLDTNVVAYVATGVYHYLLATGDVDFAARLWPHVRAAIDFVFSWRLGDGTVRWSLDAAGRVEGYALLTGSSSIYHAACCALALGERLGEDVDAWREPTAVLGHCVARHPGAFAPKNEFAMDWYYPVLSGAVSGTAGERRLDDGWERHVMEGLGVRCVSTSDWVTAAETAECALALDAVGRPSLALDVFALTARHRRVDGAYWTGLAYPQSRTFPNAEVTSYTAAAVILAADALTSSSGASDLFRHGVLARPPEQPEIGCPHGESRRAPLENP